MNTYAAETLAGFSTFPFIIGVSFLRERHLLSFETLLLIMMPLSIFIFLYLEEYFESIGNDTPGSRPGFISRNRLFYSALPALGMFVLCVIAYFTIGIEDMFDYFEENIFWVLAAVIGGTILYSLLFNSSGRDGVTLGEIITKRYRK
ncbi:MAG TPA: hypothetical protein PKY31_01140 [Spirochaetota bacterium]|nr:hypothetical protein [Spirochaetota bacterium]